MEPFATVGELTNRLDWDLSPQELNMAAEALEDASTLVRAYGRDWPHDAAPALAKTLTLKSAARYMRNPDGYTQSRAGDETVAWTDRRGENEGVYLSDTEIKLLTKLVRGQGGIVSVQLMAWRTTTVPATVPVPTGDGNKPFPYPAPAEWDVAP